MAKSEDNIIIVGRDCEGCVYCDVREESKSKVYIFCDYKNKRYFYGQCIPCDNKRKGDTSKDESPVENS